METVEKTLAVVMAAFVILLSLAVLSTVQAQARSCLEAPANDLHEMTKPIEGRLVRNPSDSVFVRFTGLKVGEEAEIIVDVKPSERSVITVGLYREAGRDAFAVISEKQVIATQTGQRVVFRWHEGVKPADLCLKILQFSEVAKITTNYTVVVGVREKMDAGKAEAPPTHENAIQLGKISVGREITITGYLSDKETGSDHVDYYLLVADVREKGERLVFTVETSPDSQLSVAVLDRGAAFALASNKTTVGKATLNLRIEETGEHPFYLKVSNEGGTGGEAEYSIGIKMLPSPVKTNGIVIPSEDGGETIVIDDRTARLLLLVSVAAVAAASITAIVREAKRRRTEHEVYIDYGW